MGILDTFKDANKMRKIKAQMDKELEQIFVVVEKSGVRLVVRGDKHIEKIEIDGDEDKSLKDIFNTAMKEVDKKVEKRMKSKAGEFGL